MKHPRSALGACIVLLGATLPLTACISYRALRASSVDQLGLPASRLRVPDKRVATAKRLRAILERRGFSLALSPPAGTYRVFVFKAERARRPNHRVGSWLAARLELLPNATDVLLFGKPMLDGQELCSTADAELAVAQYWCRDTKVRQGFSSPDDLSGGYEAKLVREVLDELKKQGLAAAAVAAALADARRVAALAASKPAEPAQRAKPIVAIFALEDRTRRCGPKLLGDLHAYLATRLAESGRYRVVPGERLTEQLKAAKKQSYRRCYDAACQVEIGKALAAQKTLSTRIVRLGSRCTLTANLYDLKTETAEQAASASVACRGEALRQGIDTLAAKLAGGTCESDKTVVLDHKKHCSHKSKPTPPFGLTFRLCGGSYTLRAVAGAARYWRETGGYGWNAALDVLDSGVTVELTQRKGPDLASRGRRGPGKQGTWPTAKAALRAMAKQSVRFEVPAGGSKVQLYSVDEPCRDNSGTMTMRISRR